MKVNYISKIFKSISVSKSVCFYLGIATRTLFKKKILPFKGILHFSWFKLSTSFFSMLQYSAWHKKEAFCTTKVNFVAVRIHFDEAVLYVKNGQKPTFALRSHALFFFLGNTWFQTQIVIIIYRILITFTW